MRFRNINIVMLIIIDIIVLIMFITIITAITIVIMLKLMLKVEDPEFALTQLCLTSTRGELGKLPVDQLFKVVW